MDKIKEITQNPQRYSKKQNKYQISATSSIQPLDLPFGPDVEGLLPVLEVDGIIVNVGEWKLVSQATLDRIKNSNNPHYDIKDNGKIELKSGSVQIGKTIPSITLNVDNLKTIADERTQSNRTAGVVDVDYVYEGSIFSGSNISTNLIKQINYTLSPVVDRPEDGYTLTELELSDPKYYDITNLTIVTTQDTGSGIFDYNKLAQFLSGVKERQSALQRDLNYIKGIFFNGDIPSSPSTYKLSKMAKSEDTQTEVGESQVVYRNSELVSIEKTPAQQIKDDQQAAIEGLNTTLQQTVTAQQAALVAAQGADSRTQQYIQQQLDATRTQLEKLQKTLQSK